MRPSTCLLIGAVLAFPIQASCAVETPLRAMPAAQAYAPNEKTRKELLEARDTAWRAFFRKDPATLETILGPEVIAIQENAEPWDNRTGLLALAKAMNKQGMQILRLEFPHTEIQWFGNTAVMYYTYVFETGVVGRSAVDAGRGTEVFVRRAGKWIDVGWHLDNGGFVHKGTEWVRAGGPYPEPTPAPPPQPGS